MYIQREAGGESPTHSISYVLGKTLCYILMRTVCCDFRQMSAGRLTVSPKASLNIRWVFCP